MIDFTPVRTKQMTIVELAAAFTVADLRQHTHDMLDAQLKLIADCTDADVVFIPNDPEANDSAAADAEDVNLAWHLGHVLVHCFASAEEAAFIAAELARGVPHRGGRSRYETPWQTITTIAQCRAALEASRKMRLATLDVWPTPPHLENTYQSPSGLMINANTRFVNGLRHDDDHLPHIVEIVRQAKTSPR